MVAARRQDGLYDVPEAGLQGVPGNYIPDDMRRSADDLYNQQAVAPPTGPDARLAMNGGGGSTSANVPERFNPAPDPAPPPADSPRSRNDFGTDSQGAGRSINNAPEAAPPAAVNASYASEPAGVSPAQLNGPGSPGATGAAQPSPQDKAWNEYLLKSARGTPSQTIPGGPALTKENWQQQDVVAMPGKTTVEGEPTFEPAFRYDKKLKRDIPIMEKDPSSGKMVQKMKLVSGDKQVSNEVPFNAETSKYNEAKQDIEDQTQETMGHEASHEQMVNDYMASQASLERIHIEKAERDYQEQQAHIAQRDQQFAKTLDDLGRLAKEHEPGRSAGSKFLLGIAQGMLFAGAATAGQQVPHINFLKDAIDEDLQREQMALNTGVQLGHLRLSALHQLQQNLGDPIAAAHAFMALRWENVKHQIEATAHGAQSQQIKDNAQALWHQADAEQANQARMAYGAAHQKLVENIPAKTIPGQPGGLPGIIAAVKSQFAGAPKETVDAAINQAVADFKTSEGRHFSFPGLPEPGKDRAQVEFDKQKYASRVQLDPEITGHSGTAFISNDPKIAQQAIETQAQARAASNILDDLDSLAAQAGHSLSPTQRRLVANAAEALKGKILAMAGEGMTEAKFESIKRRLNLDAYESVTTVADLKRLTEQNRKDIRETAKALIPVGNMTKTYQGDDYLENFGSHRKPE